ncbi:MAG: hypothetical protein SFX72_00030 [Isosphaeraceae bacterium]|nr:hypothetical protein [Isosphaeraceae bacterium]
MRGPRPRRPQLVATHHPRSGVDPITLRVRPSTFRAILRIQVFRLDTFLDVTEVRLLTRLFGKRRFLLDLGRRSAFRRLEESRLLEFQGSQFRGEQRLFSGCGLESLGFLAFQRGPFRVDLFLLLDVALLGVVEFVCSARRLLDARVFEGRMTRIIPLGGRTRLAQRIFDHRFELGRNRRFGPPTRRLAFVQRLFIDRLGLEGSRRFGPFS